MYLMIQSVGEAPVESFTILGLSTSRGDASAIGQFGSGAKHATLVLLRAGINPYIFCGRERLHFFSKPAMMGDEQYNKVYYQHGQAKPKETSMSLEFGELDWQQSVDMALREYISNAIDACGVENVVFEIAEKPRAKSGYTRIFVELTAEVQRYYNNINEKFLNFSSKGSQTIIRKDDDGERAKIYRKGVFVRTISWGKPSLFDYNLGDELEIDEARNMDDWACKSACGKAVAKDKVALAKVLSTMIEGEEKWEHKFSSYSVVNNTTKDILEDALELATGDRSTVPISNLHMDEILTRKGHKTLVVNEEWVTIFQDMDVNDYKNKLTHVEQKGQTIVGTRQDTVEAVQAVWKWLEELQLTTGKGIPNIKNFIKLMDAGVVIKGYYEDSTVYINNENPTEKQTILEELAHYITGATDNSRDFQDFAFKIATNMGELIW